MSRSKRVAVLASVPVWLLPGLEHLKKPGHYATWLEPLIPEFESHSDLDLHWVTVSTQTRKPIEHRVYGQTFHVLPRWKMAASMLTGYVTEIRSVRRVLKRIEPDLVHAWGSESVFGLAGAFSGITPRLFTLQGCLTEYLRLLGGSALFRLQALYEKPTVRRFSHGTAESPAARELLLRLHPTMDVRLVDYGVNREFFEAQWNPAPEPEVIFLGSISKRKGIADLIEVAKRPQFARTTFKILGDGELRSELEKQSPPNVKWFGKCDRSEVVKHLSSGWMLVVPTYADTGPTVIKEARVVGLPVVCTNAAGASTYIADGKSGYIVKPGDVDSIARAIASVSQSRAHALSMGGFAHDDQRIDLHPGTTADAFANIYTQLIR